MLVAMVNLFGGEQWSAQYFGHDLGVLSDVSTFVRVGVTGFPDVDVAAAARVPALALIQRPQWAPELQLPVVARAIPATVVGFRAIRKVAAASAFA